MGKKRVVWALLAIGLGAASVRADGGVSGKASFKGKAPTPQAIRMDAAEYCVKMHPEAMRFQPVQVGKNGGLADVFVYVAKGLEGKKFPPPRAPQVVLDQRGCWYSPRVLGVMVGQKLVVKNSDDTMHNVNAQPFFNIPTGGQSEDEKVFDKPKIMQRLRCNIHSWMTGFIGVMENPFYAVTDSEGNFVIRDLPPGTYTLRAWHEKLGEKTAEVTVNAGGAVAEFKFDADAIAPARGPN